MVNHVSISKELEKEQLLGTGRMQRNIQNVLEKSKKLNYIVFILEHDKKKTLYSFLDVKLQIKPLVNSNWCRKQHVFLFI